MGARGGSVELPWAPVGSRAQIFTRLIILKNYKEKHVIVLDASIL